MNIPNFEFGLYKRDISNGSLLSSEHLIIETFEIFHKKVKDIFEPSQIISKKIAKSFRQFEYIFNLPFSNDSIIICSEDNSEPF